jgi:hypothetical protein
MLLGVEFHTIRLQIFFDLFKAYICYFNRYFVLNLLKVLTVSNSFSCTGFLVSVIPTH